MSLARTRSGTPSRPARSLAAGALLLALALPAGCSQGPRPAEGSGASARGSGSTRVWKPGQPDTLGPVLAVVGTRKITRHEVDSLIATAPTSMQAQLREPEGYRQAIDRLMTEEVYHQAAKRAGTERDSGYVADLDRTARTLLLRHYYEGVMRSLPEIPDSAAQAYYDQHPEEFTIHARARVRHIALPSRSQALAVRRSLVKGALWDETVAKRSTDQATRATGGLIGWVTRQSEIVPGIGKAPAIVEAAFKLPLQEISQPIRSEKTWHLIRVEAREEESKHPFGAVRERIRLRLASDRREAFGKTLTDSLLRFANATVFDDSIKVALVPARTAEDFFKEAQAAATPLQRIELYRLLIQRFPEERVSIQARFMIGFTYAEELGEYDLARKEFEEFLKRYPDSELAGSAQWMLENMDKPAPQLEEDESEKGSAEPPAPGSTGSGSAKRSDSTP